MVEVGELDSPAQVKSVYNIIPFLYILKNFTLL